MTTNYMKEQNIDDDDGRGVNQETAPPALRSVFRTSSSACGKQQQEKKASSSSIEEAQLERLLRRANLICDDDEEENNNNDFFFTYPSTSSFLKTATTNDNVDKSDIQTPTSFANISNATSIDDDDDYYSLLVLESCYQQQQQKQQQQVLSLGWNTQICENTKGKIMLTTMNFDNSCATEDHYNSYYHDDNRRLLPPL